MLEGKLINLLAKIYSIVNWKKMHIKNAYDVFNHRVRAASRRATLYEAVSKLCNYFGLQSIPIELMNDINNLRKNETEVLNKLSREHIAICMMAIIKAKEMKGEKDVLSN